MDQDLVQKIVVERPGGQPIELVLRSLTTDDDYARCEALQRDTWGDGDDFPEMATATMMMISQKVGGLAAGAFDGDGELLGLVFGITGLRDGRRAHWSHILAVRQGAGGLGIGRRLKLFQRDFLLRLGVEAVGWSYDPLVARNAHLNIHRLGTEPVEYVRDLYGAGDANDLHAGLGTDRFIVEWRIADPAVAAILAERPAALELTTGIQPVNADAGGAPRGGDFPLPDAGTVHVAVPGDIQAAKEADLAAAQRWRGSTRRAFEAYLGRGYRVVGFARGAGEHCTYVLRPGEETP